MYSTKIGPPTAVTVMSLVIAVLAVIAAATGIFWQDGGNHYDFTTLRGQTVQVQGGGLYSFDSVAGASQEIGQDVVTLGIGIPLLLAACAWAAGGSLRGKVLRAGTLGYFLYTYTSMAMLSAYNQFFLLYVALMSLSLFAFVMSLLVINVASLPAHFSKTFPRRTIAGFNLFVGAMLAILWLGLIVPPLLAGTTPFGLESYTTLVIQAMDLGLIMPTAILAGVLLLRRVPFGYLLSSVVLVKGFTMGAALLAMTAAQMLAGVQVDQFAAIAFATIAVVDMSLTILLFRSISDTPFIEEGVTGLWAPEWALQGQVGHSTAPLPAGNAMQTTIHQELQPGQ